MLTVAIPKRNKLQNIIVLTPKDGSTGYKMLWRWISCPQEDGRGKMAGEKSAGNAENT